MEKLILPDLTKLTLNELGNLLGEIMNKVYYQTAPLREEIGKRLQEEKKKEQENLKKAS